MQIALLSGANPKSCKVGPVVRLIKGSWSINVQGLVDSILSLHIGDQELVGNSQAITLDKLELVQLKFVNRGTEPYITAFAEKI